jgi:hypothetical protein
MSCELIFFTEPRERNLSACKMEISNTTTSPHILCAVMRRTSLAQSILISYYSTSRHSLLCDMQRYGEIYY